MAPKAARGPLHNPLSALLRSSGRCRGPQRRRLVSIVLAAITTAGFVFLVAQAGSGTSAGGGLWDFLGLSDDGDGAANGVPFNASDDSNYPGGCMPFQTRLYVQTERPSEGHYRFPYVRPPPHCRTFNLPSLEALVARMRTTIRDPDLFRLFENAYPNTLDTLIKWHGFANRTDPETGEETATDEELTYVITGDIDAMWLRDSAAQMLSYRSLLADDHKKEVQDFIEGKAQTKTTTAEATLSRLWRGLINLQARYVLTSPYCHSFQPPRESGIPPTDNPAYKHNHPYPVYDPELVFDCKWELDSLASFLRASAVYHAETGDTAFFARFRWIDAVEAAVDAAGAMRTGMYDEAGHVLESAYTFTGWTDRGTETLTNLGLGNPTRANGMVRTAFRPSDDAAIFQFLVPANMMWAAALEDAAHVMGQLAVSVGLAPLRASQRAKAENLTRVMRTFADGIRAGVAEDAVVRHRLFGDIFAYEVDGYGSANLMDDANIPSLLSIPLLGFFGPDLEPPETRNGTKSVRKHDYHAIYQNTRRFALSKANPYFAWGAPGVLQAVGGPHMGPGKAWPMAAIVAALTAYAYDDDHSRGSPNHHLDSVVAGQLAMLLNSTGGAGIMHESVDTWSPAVWTRPWFGWANGLFGELILAIASDDVSRPEHERLLSRSWQPPGPPEAEDNEPEGVGEVATADAWPGLIPDSTR